MTENNVLSLTGTVDSFEFGFVSQHYEEKFYQMVLTVPRLSEKTDKILIIFPERLVYDRDIVSGMSVTVRGQIRSRKWKDEQETKHLSVYGYGIEIEEPAPDLSVEDKNFVRLEGSIKFPPRLRRTNHLKKVICDFMLEVDREYDKVDTIPCIAWGKDALAISEKCRAGDKISVVGRFQSRGYYKRETDTYRTVQEVSVNTVEVISDEEIRDPGNPGISDTVLGSDVNEQ